MPSHMTRGYRYSKASLEFLQSSAKRTLVLAFRETTRVILWFDSLLCVSLFYSDLGL